MITDVNDNYPSANLSTDKFSGVYNKVDEITGITNEAQNKTLYGQIEGGSDSAESMIRGSYSSVKLLTGTYPLFMNITSNIAQELGVDPIVPKVAFTAFGIMITFGLLYLIFRYK